MAPSALASQLPDATEVKGIYLTAWHAGQPQHLAQLLALIERTELNAVVVDVKDDSGQITFPTDEASARAAGAVRSYITDAKAFTADLKSRGIYSIARLVAFKDPIMAAHRTDWAALDRSGAVWRDYNGVAWLDPYNQEAWAYLVRVAKAAAAAGFDEVQFDYVRFPTDGDLGEIRYPKADGRAPQQVIADFLDYARAELNPLGVAVSADVFGLVTSVGDDMGIGQQLEAISASVDFLSPMLYPSHYERGNLGLANPNAMPYETILRSLQDAKGRIERAGLSEKTAVRPWLQDFSWGHTYGAAEVRAQIQATYDAGYSGWLLWNQANEYTEAALLPQEVLPPYYLSAREVGAPVQVVIDGKPLQFEDVHPFVTRSTSRTLIPLRALSEALGATVAWEQSTGTARVSLGSRTVAVVLGEEEALLDGKPVTLSQSPVLYRGRTLVPLRFLVEGLGAQVTWEAATGRVIITTGGAK